MEETRPQKRIKRTRNDAFHDAVPVLPQYDIIQASEGRLVHSGSALRTAPLNREAGPALGTWEAVTVWDPPDDKDYALEPDGAWYDEVLEGEVMRVVEKPPLKVKAKRSRVSVIFFSLICSGRILTKSKSV